MPIVLLRHCVIRSSLVERRSVRAIALSLRHIVTALRAKDLGVSME